MRYEMRWYSKPSISNSKEQFDVKLQNCTCFVMQLGLPPSTSRPWWYQIRRHRNAEIFDRTWHLYLIWMVHCTISFNIGYFCFMSIVLHCSFDVHYSLSLENDIENWISMVEKRRSLNFPISYKMYWRICIIR